MEFRELIQVVHVPFRRVRSAYILLVKAPLHASVIPAQFPVIEKWEDMRNHWLAVEVYSRSSRIYDHDFKRDNYLKLGVREVWLVDRIARSVEISRELGRSQIVSDVVLWNPPLPDIEVRLELSEIFAGIE